MTIRGGLLLQHDQTVPIRADVVVQGGRIAEIGPDLDVYGPVIDADGLHVIPGGIDPHVHFDDPGYTHREDFLHGTRAAAAGGVTTVIDMPFTSIPPVTSLANLEAKLGAIRSKAVVDYGFYAGVSAQSYHEALGGGLAELAPHVLGVKCYTHSSMEGLGRLDHYRIGRLLELTPDLGRPLLVHAEDSDFVEAATAASMERGSGPLEYYASRPEAAETIAVAAVVELAMLAGGDLHGVHVATGRAVEIVAAAASGGGSAVITCDTAPHYLAFDVEDFIRIGSALKVAPCVKGLGTPEALWGHLASGAVRFVASDHAPSPVEEKSTGSIWEDYGGIPGCQTLLPYLYSAGFLGGRLDAGRFVAVTSHAAALRYGIAHRKGSIEVGRDADLVLMDPAGSLVVKGRDLESKGSVTPFEGLELSGRVIRTLVRGEEVYDWERGVVGRPGHGEHVRHFEEER